MTAPAVAATASTNPRWMHWVGWILGILPALVLLFSASMKFTTSPELTKGLEHLGWPETLTIKLAVLEIACTLLYLIPRTAVLGAILLTGYLGGAIATHVRVGDPFVTQAILGVLVWLGLFLRDARLRVLLPIRR